MIYKGYFSNIEGENFRVIFTKNDGDSSETIITLSDNPVTITMSGNTGDIFKPIRYTSATVNIVDKYYIPDLTVNKVGEVTVRIESYEINDNMEEPLDILFLGYIEPISFSQGYNNTYEEFTINCIDKLSALSYKNYERITTDLKPVSFLSIINNMFDGVNISQFDVTIQDCETESPDNNYAFEDGRCLEWLYISEENFFDEDGEPMKQSEVLEQICRYLSLSCIQYKTQCYFIDYSIFNNHNKYYFASYYNGKFFKQTTKDDIITINGANIVDSNNTITIDSCYNKIKIVCDLYEIDNTIIPDILDDANLTNVTQEFFRTWDNGKIIPFECNCYRQQDVDMNEKNRYMWYFTQNLLPKDIKVGYVRDFEVYNEEYGNYSTLFYPGNFFATLDETTSAYPRDLYNINLWTGPFVFAKDYHEARKTDTNDESKFLDELDYSFIPSLKNYLCISAFSRFHGDSDDSQFVSSEPIMKLISPTSIILSDGYNICFNISASVFRYLPTFYTNYIGITKEYNYDELTELLLNGGGADGVTNSPRYGLAIDGYNKFKLDSDICNYIEFYIKFGGKYYRTRNDEYFWSEEPGTCKIPFEVDEEAGKIKIKQNIKFFDNVSKECYTIQYSSNVNTISKLEIAMLYPDWLSTYANVDMYNFNEYASLMVFDNFDIWVENTNIEKEINDTDDTIYEVTIDDTYSNEFEDISLKICTWDNKKPNYSAVMLGVPSNNDYYFVDKLTFNFVSSTAQLRFEEKILCNYYSQYCSPALVYNTTVNRQINPYAMATIPIFNNDTSGLFILDSYQFNPKYNENNIILRELLSTDFVESTKDNIKRQFFRTGLIFKENPQ